MKNAFILFNFACITVNTNKEKLENAIIEIKNAEYIYLFARDVKGANMYKCLYEIKKLNSQNNFSDLEISLEINIILRNLASIHNCVDTVIDMKIIMKLS